MDITIEVGVMVDIDERTARRVAEEARESDWQRPSFGKQLFLGDFRLDLLHPHPALDEDAVEKGEAFLRALRGVCEQIDGHAIERDALIPDEVIKSLKEVGALGMKIPVEYGGLGLSQVYYNRALMLAGSAHPSLGALLSAHQSIGVPQPVKLFGTTEQKQKYLPRCVNEISAFLLTEPDVGSDPARMRTTATPDGDDYLIDGLKLWTTNGVVSDLVVVMARVPTSDGHPGGITTFVVEGAAPGITVENRNSFIGLRGIENGVTRFHQVRVPSANRIGKEGHGLKIALTTLNTGRLSLPALCVGASKWCTTIARGWSAERVQWGRPVGKHEAIANKIAFIAATTYGMEAMTELSSFMADDNRNDIRIEAALAKLYTSEMSWLIADDLVQIRGGRGYETAESQAARGEKGVPAEQVLRDLRINRIFEGSSEIMHLLIAREAVDAHLSVAGDIIDPDASLGRKVKAAGRASVFYARWLPTLLIGRGQVPGSYREFGKLARHVRYVERSSRKLARTVMRGAARWQGKLEYRQGFLARMVDIGAELFAISAACVRAHRDATPEATELADAFCRQSRVRVEELFTRMWHNSDATDRALADGVLAGRYRWMEEGVIDSSIPGPWISDVPFGPSTKENVHRVVS